MFFNLISYFKILFLARYSFPIYKWFRVIKHFQMNNSISSPQKLSEDRVIIPISQMKRLNLRTVDLDRVIQLLNHSQDWNLGLFIYIFTIKKLRKESNIINSLLSCYWFNFLQCLSNRGLLKAKILNLEINILDIITGTTNLWGRHF